MYNYKLFMTNNKYNESFLCRSMKKKDCIRLTNILTSKQKVKYYYSYKYEDHYCNYVFIIYYLLITTGFKICILIFSVLYLYP